MRGAAIVGTGIVGTGTVGTGGKFRDVQGEEGGSNASLEGLAR